MTSNTLWTQQMLNILISWLGDHTHYGSTATALNRLSSRRSKTTTPTPTTRVLSSPPAFITLLVFCLDPSVVGLQALERQAILASELSYMSLSQQKKQGSGDGQTPDLL